MNGCRIEDKATVIKMFELVDSNSAIAMVSVLGVEFPIKVFGLGMISLVGVIAIIVFILSERRKGDDE